MTDTDTTAIIERLDHIADVLADKLGNLITPYDLEMERRAQFDQQHSEQMQRFDHIADMLGIIADAIKETKNG